MKHDDAVDGAAAQPAADTVWRDWMRQYGRHVRRVREFLGLSQDDLAQRAGVSQGAVSRFETGRGVATPLLVVLRIDVVLRRELRRLDPSLVSPDLQRALATDTLIFSPLDAHETEPSPTGDPALEELVRLYRQTPESARAKLLAILRAAVPALRAASPQPSNPPSTAASPAGSTGGASSSRESR